MELLIPSYGEEGVKGGEGAKEVDVRVVRRGRTGARPQIESGRGCVRSKQECPGP